MTDTRLTDEILAELTGNILPFWRERVRDSTGHFISEMDAQGHVIPTAHQGLTLIARLLWTYSAFYRWSQDARDRSLAEHAYSSLQAEFRDPNHGGYAWALDHSRQVVQPAKKIYGQAFCIYALSEFYLATNHATAKDAAIQLYRLLEQHAHDPVHGGYFEVCQADWSLAQHERPSDVDKAAPKSMNTQLHVLEAYTKLARIWPDTQLQKNLDDLLQVFVRRILNDDKTHMHHSFEANWAVCSDNYTYGHDIEASWLLCEAAEVLDLPKRSKGIALTAKKLARTALDEGLGADGGLYHEGCGGRPTDRSKIWWVQAEAVVGLLNMFTLTNDQQYLRATNQVWQYIHQNMIDRQHGEWHWRIDTANKPDPAMPKVSTWKSPYHNGRMCLEVLRRML